MQKRLILGSFIVTAFWLGAGIGTATAAAEDGKKIFEAKKCINCHSLGTQKGPMVKLGGPLDGVGGKRDAAWLKGYLTDPKSQLANAKMPKTALTEKEIDDLVQYMLSLK
jgi:cytochrome c2